ncbi:MAG: hypothetical protein HFJ02_00335 [Bacilli bacterium]|nr:hypothetical protein [Bacilli bacterium]
MSQLKEKFDKITEQRGTIIDEIKRLKEDEKVKRYIALNEQNNNLYSKQLDLYQKMKTEEYGTCKHILVYSKRDYERYEGRTYLSCGCIKCGLDNSVLNYGRDYLSGDREIMYDYLRKNVLGGKLRGIETEIDCDLDLAKAIYSKIKKVYPIINDTTANYYFQAALHDIRNIKVSDNREMSRARRLSLNPKFKNWNSQEVYYD